MRGFSCFFRLDPDGRLVSLTPGWTLYHAGSRSDTFGQALKGDIVGRFVYVESTPRPLDPRDDGKE